MIIISKVIKHMCIIAIFFYISYKTADGCRGLSLIFLKYFYQRHANQMPVLVDFAGFPFFVFCRKMAMIYFR